MDYSHAHLETIAATRPLRYFEQIASTNGLALEWIHEGTEAGSVVLTNEQFSGRGRLGRRWFAPAGTALLFTYIYSPPNEFAIRSAMLGALAVAETCTMLGVPDIGIKYPNDVQSNGLKLSGILAEAATSANKISVALGIGLNVRVDFSTTPFEYTAASLEQLLNRPLDRLGLLSALLDRLDYWRDRIASDLLFESWKDYLNMLGKPVEINTGGGSVSGIAQDVLPSGALILERTDGKQQQVMAGDLVVYR
ncbi:MAG: biotin--[acetyl-CoA-carboxylase] ligase [Anaerolineae bacterium]|nr:biotin--[acetyl-CoA-carboxylase] ligase [Anaerolineae bacterium]